LSSFRIVLSSKINGNQEQKNKPLKTDFQVSLNAFSILDYQLNSKVKKPAKLLKYLIMDNCLGVTQLKIKFLTIKVFDPE